MQVLQLPGQNLAKCPDFENGAKWMRIQALASDSNSKFNQLNKQLEKWKQLSWWRNVLLGNEESEQNYLLLQTEVLSQINDCYKSLDNLKFHFQAYLAELFEASNQQDSFEFFLLLCPAGPIKQYYQGLALLRESELQSQSDQALAMQLYQQAKTLILEAQKSQLLAMNQQDADFCRALYYSDLNACFDAQDHQEQTLHRVAARRIFYSLSEQQYIPAMHELARFRLSAKGRGQLPLRTARAMDLCLNAAEDGYVPAMITAATVYWRYLSSEWTQAEVGWPPAIREAIFGKRAEKLLLDAYFVHDDKRARDILADIIDLVEGAVAPLDSAKEAVLQKLQSIYREFHARKEAAIAYRNKAIANLRPISKNPPSTLADGHMVFRFLANYSLCFGYRIRAVAT